MEVELRVNTKSCAIKIPLRKPSNTYACMMFDILHISKPGRGSYFEVVHLVCVAKHVVNINRAFDDRMRNIW